MILIMYVAIALTVFCGVVLLLAPILLQASSVERRLLATVHTSRSDERTIGRKERVEEWLLSVASGVSQRFRKSLGFTVDDGLKGRLFSAGYKRNAADIYFAARFLSPLLGVSLGSLVQGNTLMGMLAGAGIGYLLPDLWLRTAVKRRREKVRKAIPDSIDLLTICVDAGMGLDQALQRVCGELRTSYPEIHEEFLQINLEQRAGKPRVEAWQSMAKRTELPEIAAFVTMLMQTERFGTPITKALMRLSDDIRLKRRQRAEEMAAKTKIKILFPLVLCIFPCIFIVLLAPAVLNIGKTLGSLGQ